MPSVSPAQHKLMEIAAHTPGGYGGVPQSVGKEFVSKDAADVPDIGEAKRFTLPPADATDHAVAEGIRDGIYASPQKFGEFWFFDLRITGTGMAWREALGEYAHRDPDLWLSPEFLERCNGLAVIFEHPEKAGLNHEEYRERSIGAIVLPYIKGDEVWGIAKIFDDDAALAMQNTHRSTSPGVTPPKGTSAIALESGAKVLDEGLPLILDHLAVCEAGVWDKDGPPEGVRLDSLVAKEQTVTEEERKTLEKERDDAKARADAAEAELKKEREDRAKKDHDLREREDKARKDAEESENKAVEAAEKEKADKKRDARKDRHAKHDAKEDILDCSRCDAEEAEEELEDKKRKDGAPVEEANANREQEVKDSKARIAMLESKIAELARAHAPLTNDEANEIAKAHNRADAAYAMLNERAPIHVAGEKPIAYRRRLADGLRKFTKTHKNEPINDSITGRAFELIENEIYAEAQAEAKNPTRNDSIGLLIETRSVGLGGKQVSRFTGDPNVAWAPFTTPRTLITKFNNRANGR